MKPGEDAPDFEADSTIGKIKLSNFRGKKVILYFYPKSFTSGCTRELQRFVQLYSEFKNLNAEIIGVSTDKIDTQRKFAEKYGATFPIVADDKKMITQMYGVLNDKGTSAQRVTFIIDESGKIIEILRNLKKAEEHADKSLEIIKKSKN